MYLSNFDLDLDEWNISVFCCILSSDLMRVDWTR